MNSTSLAATGSTSGGSNSSDSATTSGEVISSSLSTIDTSSPPISNKNKTINIEMKETSSAAIASINLKSIITSNSKNNEGGENEEYNYSYDSSQFINEENQQQKSSPTSPSTPSKFFEHFPYANTNKQNYTPPILAPPMKTDLMGRRNNDEEDEDEEGKGVDPRIGAIGKQPTVELEFDDAYTWQMKQIKARKDSTTWGIITVAIGIGITV